MSNWEKFKDKKEEKPEGLTIGGNYMCQFCPLIVSEATYFPTDSVLKYKCSDGHTSFLEGFHLF